MSSLYIIILSVACFIVGSLGTYLITSKEYKKVVDDLFHRMTNVMSINYILLSDLKLMYYEEGSEENFEKTLNELVKETGKALEDMLDEDNL